MRNRKGALRLRKHVRRINAKRGLLIFLKISKSGKGGGEKKGVLSALDLAWIYESCVHMVCMSFSKGLGGIFGK